MQPLEAAVILNPFDHVEFLISAALWSAYVSKHDGLILLGMWVSVVPLSPLLLRVQLFGFNTKLKRGHLVTSKENNEGCFTNFPKYLC